MPFFVYGQPVILPLPYCTVLSLKLNSKILLGFAIATGVLLLTTVASLLSIRGLGVQTRSVEHTYQVLQTSEVITSQLKDAQAGVRGYLLTGDTAFLHNYHLAPAQLETALARMESLTPDNEPQQQRLDSVRQFIRQEFRTLAPLARTQTALTRSVMHTLLDTDRQTVRLVRAIMDRVRKNETSLLAERSQRQDLFESTTPLFVLASTLLAIVIMVWLLKQIARELRDNRRLQGELARSFADTGRRITQIKDLAEQVVQGHYDVKIPDSGQDNLGDLATSLNRMTQTLDEVFSALAKRNQELDQFAYVASHDLKAPLRGVTTIVKWIEDELSAEISPQLRLYLDQMKGRLVRLEDLINGLLAYARVGRSTRTVEEVEVARLARDVAELVVPRGFELELAPDLPTFATDRLSLEQVFTNLFGNAVKYHHHVQTGHLRLSARDLGPAYEFRVEDDGPGIAPEYREKVFLLFQTLRDRNTAESTGIGLSIVKKIIDERNGNIWIEEGLNGHGAAFVFTWAK
jgi:signal transduction histidine kinase